VVPPEGDSVARGRKFADEGRDPTNQPESPGPRPTDQLDCGKQEYSQKNEDVGSEEDGFEEQSNELHRG
jgi:hypothetical protein